MSTSQQDPSHEPEWLLVVRIHKDGRCERLVGTDTTPAGTDPITGVRSKDVIISLKSNIFVRIYIPKTTPTNHKLPTLIYYHGGGFLTESAASPTYHPTLNLITAESNVVVVSVNYRLAPEYLIPIPYEDSWEAIKWVATHAKEHGPESWLNDHADLCNVFFIGDSSGANIAHNMAIRFGLSPVKGINLNGIILLHPFFAGKTLTEYVPKELIELLERLWKLANGPGVELDDPLINPGMDPRVSSLGCSRILVCVGEKDTFRARGLNYKKVMEKSGWKGKVDVMESQGEGHVFFLYDTSSENACALRNRICTFINPIRSKV
ncbi:putative carboxylesterase [Helianthus annuus]|nr:putative carboxylesterase [Helianthus annuus]